MLKGIFQKLLATYLAIILLVVTLLALTLAHFLEDYFFQQKLDFLLNTGRQVNTLLVRYYRSGLSDQQLQEAVNLLGRNANARIIILEQPRTTSEEIYLKEKLGIQQQDLIEPLRKVFAGETITRKSQFSTEFKSYVLAVGMPIRNLEQHRGAIVVFSPQEEVTSAITTTYRLIWAVALFASVVGFVLIFVVSKKIANPLIQVSHSAQALAQGQPVPDLRARGDDEIAFMVKSFNHMKNQLERMEKMRNELLAGVSHELRTPLTAIRGFTQAMQEGLIPVEDFPKYLALTLAETNRLTELTTDLLELAKLEAGVIKLNLTWVDLPELVQQIYLSLLPEAKEKGLEMEIGRGKGNLRAYVDYDRMQQILLNLVVNALNYTPQGGKITMNIAESLGKIRLEVKDTGIGIPEEELPFVFDKFHRVDKSRDAAKGGSGLGLAIVKNLVTLQGGEISLLSKLGQGTEVVVLLPR